MTVKNFRDACAASAIDFNFYDKHGDIFEWVTFDRNDDLEKQNDAIDKLEKYDDCQVSVFTTFNDVIRVHVIVPYSKMN